MNISGLAAGTVLALASALIAAQTSPTPLVAFTHVAIIDGTGAPLKRDQTIVVRGSHIDVVGPFAVTQVPVEARIIDATGKFMIPGLWDMHVHTHYQGIDHLRLFIAHGITSVRDMGGGSEHLGRINEWTRQIERGTITGPRIIPGGVLLDGPTSRWFHAHRISGPAEGQDAVRRLKGEGAAFVKVYDQLNHEAFVAIADAAKQHGLPIFGHIVAAVGVEAAVAAGQRSVEHANAVARAASDQAEGNSPGTVSDEKARALAEYLHRHGTAVVPTLSLVAQFARWTERTLRPQQSLRRCDMCRRVTWGCGRRRNHFQPASITLCG